ncbi:MAG TPA: TonB-dependent receptor [Opitutaceae bacterium]
MNYVRYAVAALAVTSAWPLYAQTADTETDSETITLSEFQVNSAADKGYRAANSVSATRVAVAISDLPMNLTAFTEEFIADQHAYDLYDIVKWAPGVHQDNISPQGWVRYNIRGFTSAGVQRNGFGSFRFIDTTNIARVEVIKGPSSLLYGQINPGGVINYITKRPEEKQAVYTTASVGTDGYDRFVVDATGPVPGTNGKLLYRAIAMYEDVQEFQELSSGYKFMFAPSFTWKIFDGTSLTVDYEHFERHDDMPTSGVPLIYVNNTGTVQYPGLPWDFSYAGEGDYQNFISDAITAELTTRIGEHINIRAAYVDSYYDMDWRATGQGGTGLIAQSFIDYYYPPSAGLTSADAMYRRNRWEHQWGGERTGQIDVTGNFEVGPVKIRPIIGYKKNFETRFRNQQKNNPNVAGSPYYLKPWDLRNPATWDRSVPFGTEHLILSADGQTESDSSSLYGILSVSTFNDRLQLLGGYARHELHNDPSLNILNGTVSAPASDRAANVPQGGALFKITREVSAFVSYSESFLANTSVLRVDNVPTTPAEPSVGKGWEYGLKLELLEGRVSGTVSAYQLEASPTGIITITSGTDASGNTIFTDIQGGKQTSEGFEADLLFTPITGLQIMASYSYCDAIYEEHPTSDALDGTRLVATPDQMFNLWAKYTVQSGAFKDLTVGGGLNYVGSTTYVGNNPFVELGSYTTYDLSIGYAFNAFGRKWNTDLSVKNLTDEEYYASASSWGFPRHAILSLSTRF